MAESRPHFALLAVCPDAPLETVTFIEADDPDHVTMHVSGSTLLWVDNQLEYTDDGGTTWYHLNIATRNEVAQIVTWERGADGGGDFAGGQDWRLTSVPAAYVFPESGSFT